MDKDFSPCYPKDQPVTLYDGHRAMLLAYLIDSDEDFSKRHKDRLKEIDRIKHEDSKDREETGERICMETHGMSMHDYLSKKG